MKKLFLILPLFLIGCAPYNSPEKKILNKATLSDEPEYVGTLKDGRTVGRFYIKNDGRLDGEWVHNHWVYVISDNSSSTVNYSVQSGKTTRNETIVIINGKEYVEKSE